MSNIQEYYYDFTQITTEDGNFQKTVSVKEGNNATLTKEIVGITLRDPRWTDKKIARKILQEINKYYKTATQRALEAHKEFQKLVLQDVSNDQELKEEDDLQEETEDEKILLAKSFLDYCDGIDGYDAVKLYTLILEKLLPTIGTWHHLGKDGKTHEGSKISQHDIQYIPFIHEDEIVARVIAFFF
jgi:hypothetical protein